MINIRSPRDVDGCALHQLIRCCPPLDMNSMYCNLLQCLHFKDTGAVAEMDGELVGAMTGYTLSQRPDTLFIWQVVVFAAARGQGIAPRMLEHILRRPALSHVRYIETTITEDNPASWRVFTKFAEAVGAEHSKRVLFDKQEHFEGAHESEWLMRIGPFSLAETSSLFLDSEQIGA